MTTYYSEEHVWIRVGSGDAVVGITTHAQETLGDIVFVDLPEIGKTMESGQIAGVVESVKTAADVFTPIGGVVTEVNEALRADPSLANSDPLGAGWFYKLQVADAGELAALMSEAQYLPFAENA